MGENTLIPRALKVFDACAMIFSFAIATSVASSEFTFTNFPQFLELRLSIGNAFLLAGLILSWHWICSASGLYTKGLRTRRYGHFFDILKATAFGVMVVTVAGVLFEISFVNATFVAIFSAVAFTLLLLSRFVVAEMRAHGKKSERHRPKLLIVGVNPRSIKLALQLEKNPDLAHELIGFVDDHSPHRSMLDEAGFELITDIDNLLNYLRHTSVDEVVLCLPLKSHYDNAARIVSHCEEQGITVRIVADLFQYQLSHSRTEQFGDTSVITLMTHKITGLPAAAKRSIDVLVSAIAIVVLSPVLLIVAVLVAATSSGPVFFFQERVGLNKKKIKMIKFRTMVADAETRLVGLEALNEASGPAFKIKGDPRITPIGRILRRASLDELPQLFNVLRGDMSLVGPRPLPLRDYAGFSKDWHRRRVSVKPGITCLWQIGGRDQSSFENWMKLDMQYIDHWSLLLDVKILLKTVPVVLRGTGD